MRSLLPISLPIVNIFYSFGEIRTTAGRIIYELARVYDDDDDDDENNM